MYEFEGLGFGFRASITCMCECLSTWGGTARTRALSLLAAAAQLGLCLRGVVTERVCLMAASILSGRNPVSHRKISRRAGARGRFGTLAIS